MFACCYSTRIVDCVVSPEPKPVVPPELRLPPSPQHTPRPIVLDIRGPTTLEDSDPVPPPN
jgi:hypothetical protein